MDKFQIAEIFQEMAWFLELQGESVFKSRAYRKAAKAVEAFEGDFGLWVEENKLEAIQGIGPALAQKVVELWTTGELAAHQELKASLPSGLFAMMEIPGMGPKTIQRVYHELQVEDMESLKKACEVGRIAGLTGLGKKTEEKILEGIQAYESYQSFHRRCDVEKVASEVLARLREHPEVLQCSWVGSMRRGNEVVRDINLIASSSQPEKVMEVFIDGEEVEEVICQGSGESRVLLRGGIPCDLRLVNDGVYAHALYQYTGSQRHITGLDQYALAQGKLLRGVPLSSSDSLGSERGLIEEGKPLVFREEKELFEQLGLAYIPPELREGCGEIERAAEGEIPRLIEWTELRGAFHCHTVASDGKNTMAEMARAAKELGLEYLGIADHSKSSFHANGLSEERLWEQVEQIRLLNEGAFGLHVFAGSEVDILKEGQLDYSDDVLAQLDYVVASVHSSLGQSASEMTRRVIRAMENPYVTMLGHPTCRLLLSRQSTALDVEKMIDCAAETGTWIELNANGYRLDLDWRWWRQAQEQGVRCVINPDAHRLSGLADLRLGVSIARKGWLRKEDVMNTLPLAEMKRLLQEKLKAK